MSSGNERYKARIRRHRRVRKKVHGTTERPRLCVYRSSKHIYVQLIDDDNHRCLLTVSSLSLDVKNLVKDAKGKIAVSAAVGKVAAEKAQAAGHQLVAFDRGGYLYHGRVKSLAEAARESGLKF